MMCCSEPCSIPGEEFRNCCPPPRGPTPQNQGQNLPEILSGSWGNGDFSPAGAHIDRIHTFIKNINMYYIKYTKYVRINKYIIFNMYISIYGIYKWAIYKIIYI